MPASGNYNHEKYLEFLGLSHPPFPVAPDNTDFYISQHSNAVITKLTQAILSRKGFMLLTGEVGLGKTTLSRRIIHILAQHHVETSLVFQSFYQENSLLKEIIKDFGMTVEETRNDLPILMKRLNDFLLKKNNEGINCAIVIDDAQNLTIESLELIRMISNLEADREKLVQILLVGQPELVDKLNRHELRQLKSRVAIRQSPLPLQKSEMGKYLHFKLNMAGDSGKIIIKTRALEKLYQLTSGNLRKVNILMDQALHYAFLGTTYTIKPQFIIKANKELDLDIPAWKNTGPAASFIILLLIVIILGMGGGTLFFYYYSDKKETASVKNDAAIIEKPADSAILPDNKDNPAAATMVQPPTPETIVTASVASFLSAYGLESYSLQFQQALNQKNLHDIRDTIFDQTGLHLIKLDTVTPPVRGNFDILSSIDPAGQKTEFYLFWKPWLKIVKFYAGYRGEEIRELQKLLSKVHLYDYNIDGIVGQIIMKSVKEFQRQNNLQVTGFPGPETIFMLANRDPR